MPLHDIAPGIPIEVVAFGTQANDVSSSATTVGTGADVLASALSFVADGVSSYLAVLLAPAQANTSATNVNIAQVMLDAVAQGIGMYNGVAAANRVEPCCGAYVIATPAVGVHTVNWRFYVDGGTGKLLASTGLSPSTRIIVLLLKLG